MPALPTLLNLLVDAVASHAHASLGLICTFARVFQPEHHNLVVLREVDITNDALGMLFGAIAVVVDATVSRPE